MTNFLQKHPLIKIILFIISCVGIYGGTVNYGGFDFLPAIPFLIFVVYVAGKWRGGFFAAAVILTLVCVPLYYLKKKHGPLFHPAIEREFTFTKDMCLQQYDSATFATQITDKLTCDETKILKANTFLKISSISVSNADMGEVYVIHAKTDHGELYYSGNLDNLAVWPTGEPIQQQDLRRAIFYVPSLMMYWPVLPIFLMTQLKK